jgi:hypothetical protein
VYIQVSYRKLKFTVYEGELNENLQHVKEIETLLCAAVDTARGQHGLEVCTV